MVDHHGGFDVDSYTNNVLSLCSGVGGLDIGFALGTSGRNRTICYVEREAYACALLAKRMAEKTVDEAPIWTDVHSFDGRPWRGIVDSICGGYPCQPFSTAGKRHGANDPRHLWPSIVRIIEEIQPRLVFFENVPGHLTLGFDTVCKDLERLGFNVAAGLFSAAEIGAPHERQRLFIVGVAHGDSSFTRVARIDWSTTRHAQESDNHGRRRQLADADCKSFERSGNITQKKRISELVEYRSGELANTTRGVSGITETGNRRESIRGGGAEVSEFPPRPTYFDMADTMLDRSLWIGQTRTTQGTTKRSDRGDIPDFPPGPKDFEQWERILRDNPHIAPAIKSEFHGMVDGVPNRVDRLRACGNAVVPLVAAYAFASLFPVVATNSR